MLGGHHYPEMMLASIDFSLVTRWAEREDWSGMAEGLLLRLQRLQGAGADFLMLAANTLHLVVPMIASELEVPLLHVVGPTGNALRRDGVKRAVLLGTRPVMSRPFIRSLFALNYEITVTSPAPSVQEEVHDIIIQELCRGVFRPESKARIEHIIADYCQQGISSVILGCTELELLLGVEKLGESRLYKTLELHAHAAARISIGEASLRDYEVRLE